MSQNSASLLLLVYDFVCKVTSPTLKSVFGTILYVQTAKELDALLGTQAVM